jgi:hypothetical protein
MAQRHMPIRLFESSHSQRVAGSLLLAGVMLLLFGWLGWQGQSAAAEFPAAFSLAPHLVANRIYNSPAIVISQIYGGGGEPGAPYRYDFIELFNRGATTVNLAGWSVQYASARNIGWQVAELSGALAPGQYYLIRLATSGTAGQELPDPDAQGTAQINATAGRVALVSGVTPLSGLVACPNDPEAAGQIVDFVGYGSTVICAEGATAPAPSVSLATLRRTEGCAETDENGADFVTDAPRPRNTITPLAPCNGVTAPPADLIISTVTSGGPVTQTSNAALARLASLTQHPATSFINTQTTPLSVPARGVLTFFVTVRNNGAAAAANVIVANTLPDGFTNIIANNGALITGLTVTWPVVPLLPRGASVSFSVTATAPDQAVLSFNRARCTSDTYDPDAVNNRSLTQVAVLAGARFSAQDIQVGLIDPQACQTSFTLQVQLTNTGFSPQPDTTDSEFLTNLPPELTVNSCSATKGRCRTNSASQSARWDGSINVNETVTITISMRLKTVPPNSLLPFCVTGTVKFDSDNDGLNDSSTSGTVCGEYGCSDVSLSKPLPASSENSAQKPGSVLIYNLYTSSTTNPARENTRLSLTNTNSSQQAFVHLFFVNGNTCEVSDVFVCLTANQTVSFLASDMDPGVTGYLVAVAVNQVFGCPISFNHLIGNADLKLSTGQTATLGAESFTALVENPVPCDQNVIRADLLFDGVHYNRAPRTLAIPNLASVQEGNSTFIVLNRIGGELDNQVAPLGSLAGYVYNDVEQQFSFSAQGGCQLRQYLSNTFPRTSPRFDQIIPKGQTGWLKIWAGADYGILGAAITFNANSSALATPVIGGQNMHKLTFTGAASFTMPIIKPRC